MDIINVLNDLNIPKYNEYKKLSDLKKNKKYKVLDANIKNVEKFNKDILYLTLEVEGAPSGLGFAARKYEVGAPDKYLFKLNEEKTDPKSLINKFVKVDSRKYTPKGSAEERTFYNLEFSY